MAIGRKFTLIPKKHKRAIYEYLFREGVIVVQKDPKLMKHPDVGRAVHTKGTEEEEGASGHEEEIVIPNLHVMMTLRSLHSSKYVEEKFSWQHHYYCLTNEGIEYLRGYLNLPPQVFPATLTKKMGTRAGGGAPEKGGGFEGRQETGRGRGRPRVA